MKRLFILGILSLQLNLLFAVLPAVGVASSNGDELDIARKNHEIQELGVLNPDHCGDHEGVRDALQRIMGAQSSYNSAATLWNQSSLISSEDSWLLKGADGNQVVWQYEAKFADPRSKVVTNDPQQPTRFVPTTPGENDANHCDSSILYLLLKFYKGENSNLFVDFYSFIEWDKFKTHKRTETTYLSEEGLRFQAPIYIRNFSNGMYLYNDVYQPKFNLFHKEYLSMTYNCRKILDNKVNFLICQKRNNEGLEDYVVFSDGKAAHVTSRIILDNQ